MMRPVYPQQVALSSADMICRRSVFGASGLQNGISERRKKPVISRITGFFGAVTQIRTGDLILTKDALYRLSYNSISHAPDEGGMVATEKGLEPSTSSVTG